MEKAFSVSLTAQAKKGVDGLPAPERILFDDLVRELKKLGPKRSNWPNYSKLGKTTFHCHLSYHWVACWRCENRSASIEVYYAGSRENSPY